MLPVGYGGIHPQPSIKKQIPVSTFSKIWNYSLKKKFAYFFITTLPCVEWIHRT